MKIAVDGDVLGNIYTDVHPDNKIDGGGTGVVVDKTNVLDYIVDMGTLLDEKNIPESDRWLVLPPWVCGMIKKSELKDASLAGDGTSIMRNGRLGIIDRFTLYCSNNLATASGVTQCLAGVKDFAGFASQFIKHESANAGEALRHGSPWPAGVWVQGAEAGCWCSAGSEAFLTFFAARFPLPASRTRLHSWCFCGVRAAGCGKRFSEELKKWHLTWKPAAAKMN